MVPGTISLQDADVTHYEGFFPPQEADRLFGNDDRVFDGGHRVAPVQVTRVTSGQLSWSR